MIQIEDSRKIYKITIFDIPFTNNFLNKSQSRVYRMAKRYYNNKNGKVKVF